LLLLQVTNEPFTTTQQPHPQVQQPSGGKSATLEEVIAKIPEGDITQSQFQHITNLLKTRLKEQPPTDTIRTQQQPALQPAQPQVVPPSQQSSSFTSPVRPVPVHGAGTTPVQIINTFLHKGRSPTTAPTVPAVPPPRPTQQLSLLDQYQLQHQQQPGFQPYLQPYTAKRPRSPPRSVGYSNVYDSRYANNTSYGGYNINNNNSVYYPSSSSISPQQQPLFEDEVHQAKRRYR
jgi:hypothetical protein